MWAPKPLIKNEIPKPIQKFFNLNNQYSKNGVYYSERRCFYCGEISYVRTRYIRKRIRESNEKYKPSCQICTLKHIVEHFKEYNYRWKGGKSSVRGYRYILSPNHPYRNKTGRGYVAEHRLIMEELIGRYLKRNEEVHHKNGNRLDNRPENLELWIKSHPKGQRASDILPHCATCTCEK